MKRLIILLAIFLLAQAYIVGYEIGKIETKPVVKYIVVSQPTIYTN